MTTTCQSFISRLRSSPSYWNRVTRRVSDWRRTAHASSELLQLSDRCLKDIGISPRPSPSDGKPFWTA